MVQTPHAHRGRAMQGDCRQSSFLPAASALHGALHAPDHLFPVSRAQGKLISKRSQVIIGYTVCMMLIIWRRAYSWNDIQKMARNRDHALVDSKDYKGCRECHIAPDWLLIYKREEGTDSGASAH